MKLNDWVIVVSGWHGVGSRGKLLHMSKERNKALIHLNSGEADEAGNYWFKLSNIEKYRGEG